MVWTSVDNETNKIVRGSDFSRQQLSVTNTGSDSTHYYYGGTEVSSGDWQINRFDKTTLVRETAALFNNSGTSALGTAWANRTTLNYAPNVAVPVPDKLEQSLFFGQKPRLDGTVIDERYNLGAERKAQPGRCYDFDGIDDFVDFSKNGTSSVSLGEMTGCIWVYPDSVTGNPAFFGHDDSLNNGTFRLTGTEGTGLYFAANNVQTLVTPGFTVTTGAWQHLAVSRESDGTIRMYHNGTVGGTTGTNATSNSFQWSSLGAVNGGGSYIYNGKLYDFRLYDRKLSDAEISYIYSFGASGSDPGIGNLKAWIPCEDESPRGSFDASGNNWHGQKKSIVPTSFHYSGNDVPHSYLNQYGFSNIGMFDDVNDFFTFGTDISFTGDFSIECWVDDRSDSNSMIISGGTTGGGTEFYSTESAISVYRDGSSPGSVCSASIRNQGWKKLRFERIGTSLSGYINGGSSNTQTVSGTCKFSTIGKRTGSVFEWGGTLRDLKFYDADGALIHHYPMDEGSGNRLYDIVGGNDATCSEVNTAQGFWTGGVPANISDTTKDVSGANIQYAGKAPISGQLKAGHGADFDGTDDHVELDTLETVTGDFSVTAWVYPDAVASETILGAVATTDYVHISAPSVVLVRASDATTTITHNRNFETGKWQHFALTRSGTTLTVYKNGLPGDTATQGAANPQDIKIIGAYTNGGIQGPFNGQIKDVRIYDKALSANEVKFIATHEQEGTDPTTATLLGHWPLSEGGSDRAFDISPGANHGVLKNHAASFRSATQDNFHWNTAKGFDSALYLDGVDDYVDLSDIRGLLDIDYDFSLSLNLLIDNTAADQEILSVYNGASNLASIKYFQTDNTIRVGVYTGTWTDLEVAVTGNGPHNIAVTWAEATTTLGVWVNGTAGSATTITDSATANQLYLGRISTNYGEITLRNFKVWTTQLSSADATTESNGTACPVTPRHTFNFSEQSSPIRNHTDQWIAEGTITGGTWLKIPAKPDGTSLLYNALNHPAVPGHNGAESTLDFTGNIAVPGTSLWNQGAAWNFHDSRGNPEMGKETKYGSEQSIKSAENLLIYSSELTGTEVNDADEFLGNTDLFLDHDDLTTANWTTSGVTVALEAGESYYRITNTSTSVVHFRQKLDALDGSPMRMEIDAKHGSGATADSIQLRMWPGWGVGFDISGGTVGDTEGNATGEIVDLGGGWYRCIAEFSTTGPVANKTEHQPRFYTMATASPFNYTVVANDYWFAKNPRCYQTGYSSAYKSLVVDDTNLQARWMLNNASSTGTTDYDYSSNSNDLTLTGGSTIAAQSTKGPTNKLRKGMAHDGTNDYWVAGDVLNTVWVGAGKKFTTSFWIKPESLGTQSILIGKFSNSPVAARQWYVEFASSNKIRAIWYGNVSAAKYRQHEGTTVLQSFRWYHIAMTYDQTADVEERIKIFVNGREDGTIKVGQADGAGDDIPTAAGDLEVAAYNGGALPFAGDMAEVLIFDRLLTDDEIETLSKGE